MSKFTTVDTITYDTEIAALKEVEAAILDRHGPEAEANPTMAQGLSSLRAEIARLEQEKRIAEREAAEAERGNPTPVFGALMGEFFGR